MQYLKHRAYDALKWRYDLYASEYVDLFGGGNFFLEYLLGLNKLKSAKVAYVFANKRNVGDYISHLGVKHITSMEGPSIVCSPTGKFWYRKQLMYLAEKNPGCHVIIGGGGLMQGVFEDFWNTLKLSGLSYSLVGVGVNILPGRAVLHADLASEIVNKASMLGIRDTLTEKFISLTSRPYILHCCPALNYLNSISNKSSNEVRPPYLLHMLHPSDLRLAKIDIKKLKEMVQNQAVELGLEYVESNNMTNAHMEAIELVKNAKCIVTSRLHGAIMSYAFGIPCVSILCDMKIESFIETHTGGIGIKPQEISNITLQNSMHLSMESPLHVSVEQLDVNLQIGESLRSLVTTK